VVQLRRPKRARAGGARAPQQPARQAGRITGHLHLLLLLCFVVGLAGMGVLYNGSESSLSRNELVSGE